MNSPKQGISDLPEICLQHGLTHVVIAPGSRNAPLIASFSAHQKITCYSIADERCAAYFALGIAIQTQQPVAIICTSGTAALNFAPAIAEAHYQNIPLVVLTADRPDEWIDQADGQTIRQQNIYANYSKQSFQLPVETVTDADLWYFNRSANEAINFATAEPKGPVHLNIPLREPLYAPLPKSNVEARIIQTVYSPPTLTAANLNPLLDRWNRSAKKMIVFGAGQKNKEQVELVKALSQDPSVVVVAENIANLDNDLVLYAPERFFGSCSEQDAPTFQPELLITVGHAVVSAQLKKYLRRYSPAEHWQISPSPSAIDTFQSLTKSIVADSNWLLGQLVRQGEQAKSNYRELFAAKDLSLSQWQENFISAAPFSDLKLFREVLKSIPAGSNLHLANSTPIRYSQLFKIENTLSVHANRGTSGIDGCLSTAAGCAVSSQEPTVLIVGDISFIYDSNGLWNKALKGNLKIIVVNNGGGNIFRLIHPNEGENPARDFLETPHNVNLKQLALAFGATHAICHSEDELAGQLNTFFQPSEKVGILEIVTDIAVNKAVYKDYYNQIKSI
jgi:2-succinyl-5-enolpyruvyl-6-hydroxy-3-cyclohexene-1-carboxylate synthase